MNATEIAGALRQLADQLDPPRSASRPAAVASGPGLARTSAPAPSQGDAPRVPFGREKGALLADITDEQLNWLATALQRSVDDPEKSAYKAKNERDLRSALAERDRRFAR